MIIGGLQKLSLSDFPGHTAAVVFTQGCSFRCPFCHNGALIPPQARPGVGMDEDDVVAYLRHRAGVLDAVVLSGGEPTLQADVPEFLRGVRRLGLKTAIETNGSRPEVLSRLLSDGLLDFVAMDLKAPLESYDALAGVPVAIDDILRSVLAIAESGVAHEFRTTWVKALLSAEDIEAIGRIVPAGSSHRIQEFRPETALDPSLRARA